MVSGRRVALRVVVASSIVAGAIAIGVILSPDSDARVAGNFGWSALTIDVWAVIVLCLLAGDGRRVRLVRAAGGAASVIAAVSCMLMIWREYGGQLREDVFCVAIVVVVSLAQASLLMCARRESRVDSVAIVAALALVVGTALSVVAFTSSFIDTGDSFDQTVGALLILDALASLWVWARHVMGAGWTRNASERLEPATLTRIRIAARARGQSPSALVDHALDSYLGKS